MSWNEMIWYDIDMISVRPVRQQYGPVSTLSTLDSCLPSHPTTTAYDSNNELGHSPPKHQCLRQNTAALFPPKVNINGSGSGQQSNHSQVKSMTTLSTINTVSQTVGQTKRNSPGISKVKIKAHSQQTQTQTQTGCASFSVLTGDVVNGQGRWEAASGFALEPFSPSFSSASSSPITWCVVMTNRRLTMHYRLKPARISGFPMSTNHDSE